MKKILIPICAGSMLALFACSGGGASDAQNDPDVQKSSTTNSSVGDCDPLVAEYEDLLEDYKSGLQTMIDNKEIDEDKVEEWSERGNDLSEKIQERGEKELGMKCWKEFQNIAERYQSELMPLAMQLGKIEMEKHGIDMDLDALMEQAQEE